MNPKSAEVDIVQAVGGPCAAIEHAWSKRRNDRDSRVLDEEDVDESLKSSRFQTVWKVIKVLKAHDDVLEQLDRLRVRLGRKRASGISISTWTACISTCNRPLVMILSKPSWRRPLI